LGVTAPAVRAAIMRGLIATVALDGRTNLIPHSEVEAYHAQRQGRVGRPAKSRTQPAGPAEEGGR
jgi:hypothetical protein